MKGIRMDNKTILSVLFIVLAVSTAVSQSKPLPTGSPSPPSFRDRISLLCSFLAAPNALYFQANQSLAAMANLYNTSAKLCDTWNYKPIPLLAQFHLKVTMGNASTSQLLKYYKLLADTLRCELERAPASGLLVPNIMAVKDELRDTERQVAGAIKQGQDEGVLPSTKPTGRMRIPATNPPTAAAHVACVLDDVQDAAIQIKIGACKIKDNI